MLPRFVSDGLTWTGVTGRGTFAVASALCVASVVAARSFPPFSLAETVAYLIAGGALTLWLVHARRRLQDLGAPGWLMIGLIIPLIGIGLMAVLLLRRGKEGPATPGWPVLGLGMAVLFGLLTASRVVWHPFVIPAGSMKPGLLPGDYFLTLRSLTAPERGDIVVFTHPQNGDPHVMRVAALGGDRVQMRDGVVVLNDSPVPQQDLGFWSEPLTLGASPVPLCMNRDAVATRSCQKALASEQFPGESAPHQILDIRPFAQDNTPVYDVPEGHLFVLGDNRDNALDSRIAPARGGPGFIPETMVLARPFAVIGWPDLVRSVR